MRVYINLIDIDKMMEKVLEKYLIRSDIIFKRISRPESYNYEWKRNPDFLEAINYFRKAINSELDGKLEEASFYYQKELAIRQTCL